MESKRDQEFVAVARVEDIPPGKSRLVKIHRKTIAVFNVGGTFHAINNVCPHEGGPLVKGKLKGYVVTCPWHDLQFDVRNGYGLGGGGDCVASYDVYLEDGQVYVGTRCRSF